MDKVYDVVIVGGGPAGLTAAIYLARAKYRVLVLEKGEFGGQIAITEEVVNYPGIANISGKALTEIMYRQAESFGAEFAREEALRFDFSGDVKRVITNRDEYRCLGVLLATGAQPKKVGFAGEEAYKGRGVAYCATCDGEFFTGKDVYVVGGGYAAAEESVFLTKFAKHVTVLIRKGDFSCAATVAEKAKNHEKITVLPHTILEEVSGVDGLNYLRYKNTETGEVTQVYAPKGENFGVFVLAGYAPDTDFLKDAVECTPQGYILTDAQQKTSVDGVYAAGDVCVKPLRQVVTATGDGALAATELEKYVAAMQEKTGLHGERPETRKISEKTTEQSEFDSGTRQQLETVFSRMTSGVLLKLYLDGQPVSAQLQKRMAELAAMTDKISLSVEKTTPDGESPYVEICTADGRETGLAFHGVPGGHEFSSFVLGLYNAAGPGQEISREVKQRISAIQKTVNMKILVTLSCSMCPDTVVAAQRIAVENENITAHVYDARYFEALRKKHGVMSVPCIVINDAVVSFGKKNMEEILDLIEK